MTIKNLLTSQYLFQINPVVAKDKLALMAGGVLVLIAIVLKISSVMAPTPADKKYRGKFYVALLTIGILEMVWYEFRAQNITLFGSYFANWLIILVGLVWLVWLAVKTIKHYGEEKTVWVKEQQKLKYLPK